MERYHIIHKTHDKYIQFFIFHNTLLGQDFWEISVTSQAGTFEGLERLQGISKGNLLDLIKECVMEDTQLKLQEITKQDDDSLVFTTIVDFKRSIEDYRKVLRNMKFSEFCDYCPPSLFYGIVRIKLAYTSFEQFVEEFDWIGFEAPLHPLDWTKGDWLTLGDVLDEVLLLKCN